MSAPRIFTADYYERMRRLEDGGWWNAAMRDAAAMLLEHADLPESGTLLDIGCGSGQTMAWFEAENPGWETTGVDVAPEGLTAARALGLKSVYSASALQLPFRDESVDLVITLDVIQHLPLDGGDDTALREIRRVLRPGGLLLLRTNGQAFPRTSPDAAFNFRKYRTSELRPKLEAAGLEVVRLSRINALLGLAEIPRELRAGRAEGAGYHGILATPSQRGAGAVLKRWWVRQEGRAVRAGWRLPTGRTILALCRRPAK